MARSLRHSGTVAQAGQNSIKYTITEVMRVTKKDPVMIFTCANSPTHPKTIVEDRSSMSELVNSARIAVNWTRNRWYRTEIAVHNYSMLSPVLEESLQQIEHALF